MTKHLWRWGDNRVRSGFRFHRKYLGGAGIGLDSMLEHQITFTAKNFPAEYKHFNVADFVL
jgi:hypothetical protein